MRIFITGGTGFIGRVVCAILREHELMVLCRDPARAVILGAGRALKGDIYQLAALKDEVRAFRPDGCVHLAWSGLPDYSLETSAKNFHAGVELLAFLAEIRCPRVVVSGTCFEYGNAQGCMREDSTPGVQGLFAAFKAAQRVVGRSVFSPSGAFLWARPFFVYGPGQRPTSLIPSAFRALRAGETPAVRTPDAVQDFVHVDDVAQGLAALVTSDAPAGDYNLGSGEPTRARDAVNLVARTLGRPDVFPPSDQRGDGFWANLERMQQFTQWKPRITLLEGIRQTIDAFAKSSEYSKTS